MKKVFLMVIIAMFMLTCVGNASEINKTLITTTQLDDDPTSIDGTINVQGYDKVGFWVSYDETEVGGGLSVAVTITVSYDGTNFVSGSFLDVAGGTTPQTSETLSTDSWYFFWLDAGWPYKYVKVTLTATGSDVDDIASVASYVVGMR